MAAKLEFIIGRAGTGKTYACMSAMKERLSREPLGRQRILLVPEHMTYHAERALAEHLTNGAGFLQAYVFGFRRFARQVLLETGGEHLPRISDIGRRILLKRILMQRSDELSVFARSVHKRGFTETLGRTISELKRCRLSSDLLRDVAGVIDADHARLGQKLLELSTVMDDLAVCMEGRLSDHEDRMERLAQQLKDAPFLRGAEIWVDGFDFFTPQERAVFGALFDVADHIHVSLTMEGRHDDQSVLVNLPENTIETGLFTQSYHMMRSLESELLAKDPTAHIEITLLTGQQRAERDSLAAVEENLFGHGQLSPMPDGGVKVIEAANPRIEAETVASDILRLAREEAYRYRDIAVLVRDMERYGDILTLVFTDFGVPFYVDAKRPSIHHPFAELLRAVLQAAWRGWGYEVMFRALRTGFFPLMDDLLASKNEDAQVFSVICHDWQDAVDYLENYCIAYGIRTERQWTAEEDWNYVGRTLEGGRCRTEREKQRLAEEEMINALRRRIAPPLAQLTHILKKKRATVRERICALYEFLSALRVTQTLDTWKKEADAEGRLADAAAHRQIWSSCMSIFDQIIEVGGDEEISARDYEEILSDGLDAMQISLIPPGLDHVTIASFDQNSLAGTRAVYIVGANAGTMPRINIPQGVLSDADRLSINESVCALIPNATQGVFGGGKEQNFLERRQLYRGFTEARSYLCVSYALSASDGTALSPAPLIARIRHLQPQFISIPLATVERTDAFVLAAPNPALSSLAGALLGQRERGIMQPLWRDVYNWMRMQESLKEPLHRMLGGLFPTPRVSYLSERTAARLFTYGKRFSGSTTRLETFHQCPFRHFVSYGLNLQEREVFSFQSNDFGSLLHGVLRGYGEWVRTAYANDWKAAEMQGQEKIDALLEELAPQVRSAVLLSSAGGRHRMERIRRTAQQVIRHLTSWAAASSFHPYGFELSFGRPDDTVPLAEFPLEGGMTLSLRGQIDRLDVTADGAYYIVLDYKTGASSLSLLEIRHGLKMQLLLYLFVVRRLLAQRGSAPAGMFYAPVENPVITEKRRLTDEELTNQITKKLLLTGWLIDDPEIIRRIDEGAAHICIVFNKDFSLSKKSQEQYVRTKDEFQQLLAFLPLLLCETAEDILRGDIRVSPYRLDGKNACTYCAYRAVCAFDPELGRGDTYRSIKGTEDDMMEEIRRAVQGEGEPDGT